MTARRWPTDYEPIRPQPCDDLPLFQPHTEGVAARDQVLQAFEDHRPAVVAALRDEAHRLYRELGRAISANDLRPLLAKWPGVDARILVTAFRGWRVVGETRHDAPRNHARRIYLYEPRIAEGPA